MQKKILKEFSQIEVFIKILDKMIKIESPIHKTNTGFQISLEDNILVKKNNMLSSLNKKVLLLFFIKKHDKSLKFAKKLEDIVILNLRNQNLIELPHNISLLVNLEYLFLEGNRLTTLPESLLELKKLREIHLNNSFVNISMELSKKVILLI